MGKDRILKAVNIKPKGFKSKKKKINKYNAIGLVEFQMHLVLNNLDSKVLEAVEARLRGFYIGSFVVGLRQPKGIKIPGYMIATTAIHQLGDISRPEGDLCCINKETDDDYIGSWVTGYGFVKVKFPKVTTRSLTSEEVEKYNKVSIQLADHPPRKLKVD